MSGRCPFVKCHSSPVLNVSATTQPPLVVIADTVALGAINIPAALSIVTLVALGALKNIVSGASLFTVDSQFIVSVPLPLIKNFHTSTSSPEKLKTIFCESDFIISNCPV